MTAEFATIKYEKPQDDIARIILNRPDKKNAQTFELLEQIGTVEMDRYCTGCGYCMPCEQGVKIPDVMGFRSIAQRLAPNMAIAFSKDAMQTVESCTHNIHWVCRAVTF